MLLWDNLSWTGSRRELQIQAGEKLAFHALSVLIALRELRGEEAHRLAQCASRGNNEGRFTKSSSTAF
jgi:hypothetical protein